MLMAKSAQVSTPNVRLTRKERELLALLGQYPGRVVPRKFILKNVWGYSEEAQTRTVDVHIRRLRKKLEAEPSLRIHTVFRQGYVLQNGQAPPDDASLMAFGTPVGLDPAA